MNILVTGGAGYIGSVVVEELVAAGHDVVVLDNLSTGHREAVIAVAQFVEGDIRDSALVEKTLRENKTQAVIHMAASSIVSESVLHPKKYHDNNVVAGKAMLDTMQAAGVKKIVFSSTAAVYGEPDHSPLVETDPAVPTNPYGETKLEFEREMETRREKDGLNYVSLRYFNAAGATPRYGEFHDPETHLIPLVLRAALGRSAHIDIFGDDYPTRDGTCVRDYVHVIDLARAHILALGILDSRSEIYNLGCGDAGHTVREVIDTVRQITNVDVTERLMPRRPGDPAVLVASSNKIRDELGWKPEFRDLNSIIGSAWNWMKSHPQSYAL